MTHGLKAEAEKEAAMTSLVVNLLPENGPMRDEPGRLPDSIDHLKHCVV